MTLQEITQIQDARYKAYHAGLDNVVRYGNGEILTETVMVNFYKRFHKEYRKRIELEIPADVTIGQLVQLLTEARIENFNDAYFLEKLAPHFNGKVADEWSKDTQLLEYFVSTKTSEILFCPIGCSVNENGLPLLEDGCVGFVTLRMFYPQNEEINVMDIPSDVTLEDAAAFILSADIAINSAFTADITEFL